MILPTLYKRTSTGAIQSWKVSLVDSTIVTIFGQEGGKLQATKDTIVVGKNIGRANETTAAQQAELEAKALWTKKKKTGYVESLEKAKFGFDDVVGGILPMLAHKFSEQAHKIVYPAYVQPKLDGIRCIAIVDNGECTLWSRTRKPILGVPHIQEQLRTKFPKGRHVFDGELYNHAFKADFETIVSFVKQTKPKPGHEIVEFHIYDSPVDNLSYHDRRMNFAFQFENATSIRIVDTKLVENEDNAMDYFEYCLKQGYEGAMIRNVASLYANKRSYDLLKLKEFDDAEFPIVRVNEGRGKLAGHAATFTCTTASGVEFEAKLTGETSKLKEYFDNPKLWQGKCLTVKFQGWTNKNKVPRFPIAVAVRDYE